MKKQPNADCPKELHGAARRAWGQLVKQMRRKGTPNAPNNEIYDVMKTYCICVGLADQTRNAPMMLHLGGREIINPAYTAHQRAVGIMLTCWRRLGFKGGFYARTK
mgnify:CR=1 FL=1